MSGSGLKPLSDEELLQREVWRAEWHQRDQERRQRDEQRSLEYQAAQDEAARREAAIAAEQEQKRLRQERHERYEREARQRELRDLRLKVTQQEWWQKQVETAKCPCPTQKRRAAAQAVYGPVIAALEQKLNPAPESPEPQTIYVEENQGPPKLDYPVLRCWFS